MRSENERPLTWPAGANWVYQAQITNGAGGGGNIDFEITPGARNEFEILYGTVTNGDTSVRSTTGRIHTGTEGRWLGWLYNQTNLGAGSSYTFPGNEESSRTLGPGQRILVSGTMVVLFRSTSVAASQDFSLGIVCRIRGALPTVTETGNSTPTITINEERIF